MEELKQVEGRLLDQSDQLSSPEEYLAWKEECNKCLKSLKRYSRLKRPRLWTGVRQSLVARIAHLEGLKYSFRRRFGYEDVEHSNTGLLWREIDTAFDSRVLTGAVMNSDYIEPRNFLRDARSIVLEHVQKALDKHKSLKVNTVFSGEFVASDKRLQKGINTRNSELFLASDLQEWYERCIVEPTLASLEEFQELDSGWALLRILNLTVNVNKYNPLRAGCHFKLPREIWLKRATITVESTDNACFAWAVVAALYPVEKNVDRQNSYPDYKSVLKLQNIKFPMSVNQITKFERLNNISVNVYSFEKKGETKEGARFTIFPIRLTDQRMERHVNLLYMEDQKMGNNLGHFVWIKNLSRLVSMQLSKHKAKKFICDRCLHYFSSSERLKTHTVDCGKMNDCAILLPSEDKKWLKFDNYNRKERLPFVVYADLECILEKTSITSIPAYQHHKVFSIGYYVHCSYDVSLSEYKFCRDTDCVSWFVEELKNLAHLVKKRLSSNTPMGILTKEQRETFLNAMHCHICEKPFAADETRVRDHCHLTGRDRGPAHSNCNLNYKTPFCIPILFHNLYGYDSHFIIEKIATAFRGHINVLPVTKEKYISFTKHIKVTDEQSELRNCVRYLQNFLL